MHLAPGGFIQVIVGTCTRKYTVVSHLGTVLALTENALHFYPPCALGSEWGSGKKETREGRKEETELGKGVSKWEELL